jgi:hypothetical protein
MSKNETNEDRKALPKPVALTPEEVQQVAGATALVLGRLVPRPGPGPLGGPPTLY